MKKPLILMILDGFGIAPEKGNAIKAANKPNIDKLFAENPVTQIGASGMDVGLPDGQMGNSEVGHTNMGAGRIVYQELTRITKTINEDKLKDNEAIVNAMDKAIENGTALHLMGLLSSGGVHSHNTHLYGILELAKKKGLENVYVHAFLDGRDVPPSSAAEFMDEQADTMLWTVIITGTELKRHMPLWFTAKVKKPIAHAVLLKSHMKTALQTSL